VDARDQVIAELRAGERLVMVVAPVKDWQSAHAISS
jgi:hypothetical protein